MAGRTATGMAGAARWGSVAGAVAMNGRETPPSMPSDWEVHQTEQEARFGGMVMPLRAMLDEVVDRGWEAGDHRGWKPRRGSPGDLDLRDPKWGRRSDPAAPSPVEFGQATAPVVLMAAHDHVHALSRLLGPPPAVYGTVAVARAAVEASARVAWLADLDCDRRTRAARYLTEHMNQLRWRAALPRADLHGDAEVELGRLSERAVRGGFAVRHDSRGWLSKVGDVAPPKLEWLVGELARDGGRDGLLTLYRLFSHTVHGGGFALARSMRVEAHADDPRVGVVSRVVDPREAAWMTGAVALAVVQATDRLARLFGWDNAAWTKWVRGAVQRAAGLIAG